MHFHVVTLFPGAFDSYLGESIIARALREKKIAVTFYNPRDFVKKNERTGRDKNYAPVDGKPYGGGPGMVMEALPVLRAVEKAIGKKRGVKVVLFVPDGKKFTTEKAKLWSGAEKAKGKKSTKDIVLICGRYEGIDSRVEKILKAEKISIGDYVLTGGELPAMVVIDSVARQVEGVLGNFSSREEERASGAEIYTRPEVLEYKKKKYRVPKVLLGGNHKLIDAWRLKTRKGE